MEGHATISPDILARYAGDAARETAGVHGLVPSQLLRHRGVRVEIGFAELAQQQALGGHFMHGAGPGFGNRGACGSTLSGPAFVERDAVLRVGARR